MTAEYDHQISAGAGAGAAAGLDGDDAAAHVPAAGAPKYLLKGKGLGFWLPLQGVGFVMTVPSLLFLPCVPGRQGVGLVIDLPSFLCSPAGIQDGGILLNC